MKQKIKDFEHHSMAYNAPVSKPVYFGAGSKGLKRLDRFLKAMPKETSFSKFMMDMAEIGLKHKGGLCSNVKLKMSDV